MKAQTNIKIALRNVGQINPTSIHDYINNGGYEGFKKVLFMDRNEVITEISASRLRGRGGAGFSTGSKWKFTHAATNLPKYVICNADEGEPGTFKDRVLLEEDPHSCLEGLMIAAYAVGASTGYFYIRGEYYLAIHRIRQAITDAHTHGLLGENILDSRFTLEIYIKLGGGSYLCGEESALIESLEGKRGFPRIKPPYPAEKGVFKRPTLVNNVETLTHVPEIIRKGAPWYCSMGTEQAPGTKIFTICGDIKVPGCYEAPMGIRLTELLFDTAGGMRENKKLKAVLVGGAAGTFLPPQYVDIQMDYESLKEKGFLLGSGALIVLNEDRSIKDFLQDLLRFFHHESCGKCVPCRVGSRQLLDIIKDKTKEKELRLNQLLDLAGMMFKTSLCPLGQSPIFPVRTAITHFKPELLMTM